MDDEFVLRWENEYFPTFVSDMYAVAFNEYLGKISKLSISNLIFLVKNSITQTYFSIYEIRKGNNWGLKNFTDVEIIKKIIKTTKTNTTNNHKLVSDFLKIDLQVLNNDELIHLMEKYRRSWIRVYGSFCSSQPERTELIENELKEYLYKKTKSKNEIAEYLSMLTKPDKDLEFNYKGNLLFGSFDKFFKKHKIDKSLNTKKWYSIIKEDDLISEKRRKIIKFLKIDKNWLRILEQLHELSLLRFTTRLYWMEGLYYYDLFFLEIEKRTKVKFSDLKYYLFSELKTLLLKEEKLCKKELHNRRKFYIYYINNGKYEFHTGNSAKYLESAKIKHEYADIKEITGRSANIGTYRGRVKIISFTSGNKFSQEVKKMQFGDVLVTGMTRPQLIEACEKAKAIVTDEGGVCSHAAVVSRELNIPCVVGTVIATKVFKDGDIVEVDGNTGVIKLIN